MVRGEGDFSAVLFKANSPSKAADRSVLFRTQFILMPLTHNQSLPAGDIGGGVCWCSGGQSRVLIMPFRRINQPHIPSLP